MVKVKLIFIAILLSTVSIILLFLRADFINRDLAKNLAYNTMPIILTLWILFSSRDFKILFKNLSIALGINWFLLTIAELFIYKFWVSYLTSAGQVYSSYDLHSLYPQVGFFMMILLFLAALILFVLYKFIIALLKVKLLTKPKTQSS